MNKKLNCTEVYYLGKVEFKVNVCGKLYTIATFNKGTAYLKYIFAKLLAGNLSEMTEGDMPGYIEIWRLEYDSSTGQYYEEERFTTERIALSGKLMVDIVDGLETAVSFTAYVNYDDLQQEVDPVKEANNKFYIYLLTKTDQTRKLEEYNHRLARISVTPLALSYITPGTTATVQWTMRLVNAEELE